MGARFSGASLSCPKSSPLQRGVTVHIGNSFRGLQMTEKRGMPQAFFTSVAASLALCGIGKAYMDASQQAYMPLHNYQKSSIAITQQKA